MISGIEECDFWWFRELYGTLAAFADDPQYRADATWHRRPGLTDASLVSFESYGRGERYLRHRDSVLHVEATPGDPDRAAATFRMR